MSSPEFDLAVVGGGPAGAACALFAARAGLSVAIFEPRTGTFDKPCGEGILPQGVQVLRELGLAPALEGGRPFSRLAWWLDGREALAAELRSPALALERPQLQLALAKALDAERGIARFHERARAEPAGAREGGILLRTRAGTLRARALVAADGAGGRCASWLRAADGAERTQRVGVRARFLAAEPLADVEVHLGRGCEVYLTPLPGGRVNAAILADSPPGGARGARGILEWALAAHPAARARLGARCGAAEGRALGHAPPRRVAGDGALLAGDAAGAVDPILGCGVSLALAGGRLAARAACDLARGEDPALVERSYAAAWRRESASRRRLAEALRLAGRHPRVLAAAAEVLRRSPRVLDLLVGIASPARAA